MANSFFNKSSTATSNATTDAKITKDSKNNKSEALIPDVPTEKIEEIVKNKAETRSQVKAKVPTEEPVKVSGINDDGDDDEWDDGSGSQYKPNKENLKNRKKAAGAPANRRSADTDAGSGTSQESSGDGDKDTNKDAVEEVEEEAEVLEIPQKRKADSSVRGAMDDYFDDVAIEKYKAEQEGGGGSDGAAPAVTEKRKRRKLVEKVRRIRDNDHSCHLYLLTYLYCTFLVTCAILQ
jgi:hypothetical protein